jgi:hypothetical protein
LPFLDFLNVFIAGNILHRRYKFAAVRFVLYLAAERSGKSEELAGGNLRQIPFLDLGLDGIEFFRQNLRTLLAWTQQAVAKVIQLDGGLILNLKAKFATPFNEGAAGDAQFGSDASERPTLGATFDKFLSEFRCVHNK